jgi:hypothetical protein
MFELIDDLHYDTIVRLLAKMRVQNLSDRATNREKIKLFVEVFSLLHEDQSTCERDFSSDYGRLFRLVSLVRSI